MKSCCLFALERSIHTKFRLFVFRVYFENFWNGKVDGPRCCCIDAPTDDAVESLLLKLLL